MHLSQLHIDWKKAQNPYELHRAIWGLFPGRPKDKRDFLFRVETLERHQGARVLMLSQATPLEHAEHVRLLAMRDWGPAFTEGQRLRFRLRANPIKSIADERKGTKTGKNGKEYVKRARVPLINEHQQKAWLERKLEAAASIEQLVIQSEMPLRFTKLDQKKQRMVGKIQSVMFDGVLVVRDPQELLKCLREGVGPAKSFGCGLLSLAMA